MLKGALWYGKRLHHPCRDQRRKREKERGLRRERKRRRSIGSERASESDDFVSLLSLFLPFSTRIFRLPMYPIPPVTKTLGMVGERVGGRRKKGRKNERKKEDEEDEEEIDILSATRLPASLFFRGDFLNNSPSPTRAKMASNAAIEGVAGAAAGMVALVATYPLMTVSRRGGEEGKRSE